MDSKDIIWNYDDLEYEYVLPSFMDLLQENLNLETWLPKSFKVCCGLSLLSVIAGRRVSLKLSKRKYYPNLYLLLIGESGCGKGVAINDVVEDVINEIMPEVNLGGKMTPEALTEELSKNPWGIIVNDEFKDIINHKKYMNGLDVLLTALFHCPKSYRAKLVRTERFIDEPYLSLAVGIQPKNMVQLVTKEAVSSGFIPRFLLVYGESQPEKEPVYSPKTMRKAITKLKTLNCILDGIGPVRMQLDREAIKEAFKFVRETRKKYESDVADYYSRLLDNVIKLAMIYRLDDITRLINDYSSIDNIISIINREQMGTIGCIDSVDRIGTIDEGQKGQIYTRVIREIIPFLSTLQEPRNLRILGKEHPGNRSASDIPWSKGMTFFRRMFRIPISRDEIRRAISFFLKTRESRVSMYRSMSESFFNRRTEDLKRCLRNMVAREKYEEIDGVIYLKNAHILQSFGESKYKTQPFIEILQEEGILGELEKIGRKRMYSYSSAAMKKIMEE